MFARRPNYAKLKTNLRLCVQRLKLLEKKKTELALKARREIADYIADGKEDRARVRVEHIIREDYLVEAYEMLELFCDLLLARFGIIETMQAIDDGLVETIATILWVTPRIKGDVQEFVVVSDQLTAKYSPEFAESCRKNEENRANPKLVHRMSVNAPPKALVENYLIEIAKSHKVPFTPNEENLIGPSDATGGNLIDLGDSGKSGPLPDLPAVPPLGPGAGTYPPPPGSMGGGSSPYPPPPGASNYPPPPPGASNYPPPPGNPYNDVNAPAWTNPGLPAYNGPRHPGPATGPTHQGPPPAYSGPHLPPPPNAPAAPGDTLPELPTVPTPSASFRNQPPPGMNSAGGEDVDFDDLTRRFEELKKKS